MFRNFRVYNDIYRISLAQFFYNLDLLVLILSVVRLALAVTPEIDIRSQY